MHKLKEWDNRSETKKQKLPTINGRTWTRRVQWLEEGNTVKLKFDDGERYYETGVPAAFAQKVYDRFREGQSIEDSVSIFQSFAKPSMKQSRRNNEVLSHSDANDSGR